MTDVIDLPLLSVRDLRVSFAGAEAVRGISFDVRAGETLGLVGESGSGKSVTSLALMRLLAKSAAVNGQVRLSTGDEMTGKEAIAEPSRTPGAFSGRWSRWRSRLRAGQPTHVAEKSIKEAASGQGVDLLRLPEEAMRQHRGQSLAMIFQEPMTALNPVMPIGRQVGEAVLAHRPGTPRKEVRARVLQMLQEVALPDPERRYRDYPHQFSGGQRQRIVIAMALINRPRFVIADEPTTALDVTVQAQILALLRQLRAAHGLSMLFISHDLAVVGQIADRIAVMRGGVILEQGTAHEVLTRPQHPYTRGLLAAAPTMQTPRDRALPALLSAR